MKAKKHSGQLIQRLAPFWMAFGVILTVLVALVCAELLYNATRDGGLSLLLFAVVAVLGFFLAWASAQLLRGFGELVQYTAESAAYLESIAASEANSPKEPET